MYMWMFCNHRSAQPCLHTFFIVFRRVSPHRFHTFLVNMIRHPHGIHSPCAVYFCHCHLSVILWNSSEDFFFRFWLGGMYPPWCIHLQKCMQPDPPQFFGLHWVIPGQCLKMKTHDNPIEGNNVVGFSPVNRIAHIREWVTTEFSQMELLSILQARGRWHTWWRPVSGDMGVLNALMFLHVFAN